MCRSTCAAAATETRLRGKGTPLFVVAVGPGDAGVGAAGRDATACNLEWALQLLEDGERPQPSSSCSSGESSTRDNGIVMRCAHTLQKLQSRNQDGWFGATFTPSRVGMAHARLDRFEQEVLVVQTGAARELLNRARWRRWARGCATAAV